ncbi:histidine kinase [Haloechinothrix sp. LS1_15]|uniref:sensor histidine kinase n=1 Tax=Haloechinothrix sp. LS1_15 TaxID=2652248 RepID=UPI0029486E0C|nr:histidine kinase [Haloechinothrix sp. LS1_15]MDV6011039.1 sensor histidine kinase [Haloechinothrix sp. LS1_15]
MAGDSSLALLIALIDTFLYLNALSIDGAPDVPGWHIAVPTILATVAPLVVRRRFPLFMAYAILVTGAVHLALNLPLGAVLTAAIAVYTLVVYVGRRHAGIYTGVLLTATVGQIMVQFDHEQWTVTIGFSAAVYVFAWILGEFLGARRAYHAELEARLHLLETEREHLARIAVAEERSRIARELHDVVAHSVSVIVVHADGARFAVDRDPDAVRRALGTISDTARSALAELRGLLTVLRDPDADTEEPLRPQPAAAELTELVADMRASGLDVRIERSDPLDDLPAGIALGVYRVVQEAMTNALKHAGRDATVWIAVVRSGESSDGGDTVEVTVTDDGAGKAHPVDSDASIPPARPALPVGGNGIIGMRERVHVFGGTLYVGPEPGGGWRVHAVFPLRETGREGSRERPATEPTAQSSERGRA